MRSDLPLLLDRPFWLDEWHTMLVVERPTLAQVVSDLRHGSDFAPPFVHVSLWTLRMLVGGTLHPWMTRVFTLACMLAALWFTYAALSRRLSRSAALAGVLAVASTPVIVAYAIETRFYAPWLMFAAMFAWSLSIDRDRKRSTRRAVATALAAAGLCTTHWFGVVTLGLMCLGAIASFGTGWRTALGRIAPAAAGLVALVVCLPLLIGQRGSVTEQTWIPPLSWSRFAEVAGTYWGALVPVLALAVLAIGVVWARTRGGTTQAVRDVARDPSIAALVALAAMPLALVVLSLLQPVMLTRYAITSVLAWAPLVAVAAHLMPRAVRAGVIAGFAFLGLVAVGASTGAQRQMAAQRARDGMLLRQACANGPVAFLSRELMYSYMEQVRGTCPRASYLALAPETLDRLFVGPNERARRLFRTENEFARLHGRLYGVPVVTSAAALDSLDHFVVMAQPTEIPRDGAGREYFSPLVFPRHRATPLNGSGILYERVP